VGLFRLSSMLELGQLLEEAVLELPRQYRSVIMLRDVEELSTAETAAALDLTEGNVKVRLHRGRAMMRIRLYARVGSQGKAAFPFYGLSLRPDRQGSLLAIAKDPSLNAL